MLRSPPMACLARQVFCLLLALGTVGAAQIPQAPAAPSAPRPSQLEQLKREIWFRRGRLPRPAPRATTPSGTITPAAALLQRAYQQKLNSQPRKVAAYAVSSSSEESAWAPLGPAPLLSNASGSLGDQDYGPVSGRVTAIAVDPNDPTGNTVYIGGANGGVWKSSNAAAPDPAAVNWAPLTDREATLSTGAIALQPGNSQLILVGTGEANLALDSYYGLGILRSTDGGAHWNLISGADAGASHFAGLGFSKIVFSTDHPNLVVAATSNFTFYPGSSNSGQGLYYSNDYGATWHSAAVADSGAVISQTSATDVAYNRVAGKFYAALAWHGIYSSTDGVNWARLANQPGGSVLSVAACPPSGSVTCPILRGELAVRAGRNEMYAWYVSGDLSSGDFADQGIWKTIDGGSIWTAISETGIDNCGDSDGCGAAQQGWYSLELTAVPSGATATDLYAGSTNIYKCSINSINPTCASSPFLNLTHAYGCVPAGSLAHVHPSQHAIAYAVASSGKAIMYFGNDGGVYRTLDGYGLSSGTCGQAANAFQNLNATLGSLTALVSLSPHPTDAATVLAGAQDNGSAATDSSHSGSNGTTWIAVNSGTAGYTAINPNNTSQWFTANTGVTIQRCSRGIQCLAQDFDTVVSGATLGGDAGGFATPYLLDPQAGSRLLVGTCRVWRGNSDGTGFAAASYNFDTGMDSPCSGSEDNMITALATGGTPVAAGGSPIIYAGTAGGRIFATANAASGPAGWYEATPPQTGYPISSLVLDTVDSTGKTAFATVMGFAVPHLWKTTDAGLSWTNVSGDLPDAPADSLLIDPDNHQRLYAGIDVGVFSAEIRSGEKIAWEQVGPSSAGKLLPNVAVTELSMFKSGALKLLRAATYGRGAWELMLSSPGPDYTISLNNPVLSLFPGQEGSFTGQLAALYGYSSAVAVTCEASTLPDACTGQTVTPTRGGTSFAVRAHHGKVADFSFNIKATGTDAASIVHRSAATLHVVDFGLQFAAGTPTPVALTVNSGSSADPVPLALSAQGSFSGSVNLSCSGLPTGSQCNFYPASAVTFTGAGSQAISLVISTLPTTPKSGAVPITVSATTAGAPAAKTLGLSLTVKNDPDYQVQAEPASLSAHPGEQLTTHLTFTAVNNYKGTVSVSCGASTLPGAQCSLSSSAVYLTNVSTGSITITLNVPNTATAGGYTVAVNTQDLSGAPAHQSLLSLTVVPDFVINPPQNSTTTVKQGGTAIYNLQVSSLGGAFTSPITFTCTGLPRNTTHSFTPSVVVPGSGTTTVTLKVVTSTVLAAVPSGRGRQAPELAMLLPMAAMAFAGLRIRCRQRKLAFAAAAILILLILMLGCGGGNGGAAPPIVPPVDTATPTGSYTLTVTATSGTWSHSLDLTLIVQ